jgi:ketosteroid isomerase-like protein
MPRRQAETEARLQVARRIVSDDMEENIEVVRRFYESWSKQDLAGVLDCIHSEFVLDWSASQAPFGGIYSGHHGFRRFWSEHNDVWEEFELDVVEGVECTHDQVITVTVVRGRGRGSGVRIEGTGAVLWTLCESKVLRAKLFQGKAEALAAVGLSEQNAHADP